MLRLAKARDVCRHASGIHSCSVKADVLESMALFAKNEIVGRRNGPVDLVDAGQIKPDTDKPLRIGIGQRLEHYTVPHAENGGCTADSQRQSQYSHYRKARRFAQNA